jgi:hypothetical protein
LPHWLLGISRTSYIFRVCSEPGDLTHHDYPPLTFTDYETYETFEFTFAYLFINDYSMAQYIIDYNDPNNIYLLPGSWSLNNENILCIAFDHLEASEDYENLCFEMDISDNILTMYTTPGISTDCEITELKRIEVSNLLLNSTINENFKFWKNNFLPFKPHQ